MDQEATMGNLSVAKRTVTEIGANEDGLTFRTKQYPNMEFKFEDPKAALERLKPLYDRLSKVGGRCCWQIGYSQHEFFSVRIEFWLTPKAQYMIQVWPDGGWTLFGELDKTCKTKAALAKIV